MVIEYSRDAFSLVFEALGDKAVIAAINMATTQSTLVINNLHQHLPSISYVEMDLTLNYRVNHDFWAAPVRTGHFWRCAKQPADQRTLPVYCATIRTQVYATEVI